MSKVVDKAVARAAAKKADELAAKRERSIVACGQAQAFAKEEGLKGAEFAGYVAWKSTAMTETGLRGKLAKAVLLPGKARTYTFAELAKAAKVKVGQIVYKDLFYIARNVKFRVAQVGFLVEFDMEAGTVTVRNAVAKAAKAPKVEALPAPSTEVA
jgi:hypothetical protein